MMPRHRYMQSGMSLPGMLYVLFTLGAILLLVFKCVPVYLDHQEVSKSLSAVAQDPDMQSADLITLRRAFGRHLEAGYADSVTADALEVTRQGTSRRLSLTYEMRRPLVANIALVFHFDDVAVMGSEGG